MATLDDAYNQLVEANSHLTDVHNDVQAVKASTDAVNASVKAGFNELGQLVGFEIKQNMTIICNLEKISKQTCELVNQATRQTVAQESMAATLTGLKQLYELSNPEAAVEQGRLEGLRRQIEECCPPERPEPPCKYEPCKDPGKPPRGKDKPEPPR
jgi:hypothetical protein